MSAESSRKKYSPDSSTVMMRASRSDDQPSDTIRYNQKDRPAPPPYIGQAIPRVKPIRTFQKNSVAENNSRPTSRRFDTFGENALETIYDQFKFLDESEEPQSAAQTPTSVNSTRPIMAGTPRKRQERRPAMFMYCFLPTLQLFTAIAIVAVSFFTNRKDWQKHPEPEVSEQTLSSEAMRTLSIQNSLSTVLPAFFQITSAIFGYWPLFPASLRRPAQVLHIFLNSLLIVLWFNTIYDLFFRISMQRILKPTSDEQYVTDLIVGCVVYFVTVILPSITICIATFNFAAGKVQKSMMAISVSLGEVLFSLATTVIAVFTAQANLSAPRDLSDTSTTIAYGLKEAIVFVFVVLISVYSLIVSSTNSHRPLMISAIIGQGICIISIANELFTSDRISALFNEIKGFEAGGTTVEIGIVLLNGCAIVSLLILLLQLIIFVFCVSSLPTHSLLETARRRSSHVERTAF